MKFFQALHLYIRILDNFKIIRSFARYFAIKHASWYGNINDEVSGVILGSLLVRQVIQAYYSFRFHLCRGEVYGPGRNKPHTPLELDGVTTKNITWLSIQVKI